VDRRTRPALGIALVAAAAAGALLLARDCGGAQERPAGARRDADRPRTVTRRALEIERFRANVRARRAAAARLPRPAGPASTSGRLVAFLTAPRCILGPGELCALVSDTVEACDAGDAEACLAAGQYLEDHPPRAMVVVGVYHRGCELGSIPACERVRELRDPTRPIAALCADDPVACAWAGMRAKDRDALDQACGDGVADACAYVVYQLAEDDPAKRDYLVVACELGNAMACEYLATALSPACTEDCLPPDPVQAAAAALIACEAGFTEVCPDD
jgi:hypothetical protein